MFAWLVTFKLLAIKSACLFCILGGLAACQQFVSRSGEGLTHTLVEYVSAFESLRAEGLTDGRTNGPRLEAATRELDRALATLSAYQESTLRAFVVELDSDECAYGVMAAMARAQLFDAIAGVLVARSERALASGALPRSPWKWWAGLNSSRSNSEVAWSRLGLALLGEYERGHALGVEALVGHRLLDDEARQLKDAFERAISYAKRRQHSPDETILAILENGLKSLTDDELEAMADPVARYELRAMVSGLDLFSSQLVLPVPSGRLAAGARGLGAALETIAKTALGSGLEVCSVVVPVAVIHEHPGSRRRADPAVDSVGEALCRVVSVWGMHQALAQCWAGTEFGEMRPSLRAKTAETVLEGLQFGWAATANRSVGDAIPLSSIDLERNLSSAYDEFRTELDGAWGHCIFDSLDVDSVVDDVGIGGSSEFKRTWRVTEANEPESGPAAVGFRGLRVRHTGDALIATSLREQTGGEAAKYARVLALTVCEIPIDVWRQASVLTPPPDARGRCIANIQWGTDGVTVKKTSYRVYLAPSNSGAFCSTGPSEGIVLEFSDPESRSKVISRLRSVMNR